MRIALIGDYNNGVLAHRAIDACFVLAKRNTRATLEPIWVGTESICPGNPAIFAELRGMWCVPASPYRSTEGALFAIEYARTHLVPFLGTCGGYQHALLEFARNVLKLKDAGHAENHPSTSLPLLHRMQCALVEKSQKVLVTDPDFKSPYGADSGIEGYHCSYGLNPEYERIFAGSALEIVARSEEGHAHAFRLKNHPFFVGTQFQPERRALGGSLHPLVHSFLSAVAQGAF